MTTKTARKSDRAAGRKRVYLYGVIEARSQEPGGPPGIDGSPVYTISDGRVAALVSDFVGDKIQPERRRLAAHHGVLKHFMLADTVLPMAFGLIADRPEAVREILAAHRPVLLEQLRRVTGKVEMGLHVFWDVPNIFEYFVSQHAELSLLRDRLFRGGREPGQGDKIELGRLFDRLLTEERLLHTQRVVEALRPHCFEVHENKPRNEREVMNLACLVGRGKEKEFEQGVFEAARFFDHHYAFDFNGPWPPHNFVEAVLNV